MVLNIAVQHVQHGEALEVVADIQFIGHAHAAMDLHRLLADEAAGLADLHLGGGDGFLAPDRRSRRASGVAISVIETACS